MCLKTHSIKIPFSLESLPIWIDFINHRLFFSYSGYVRLGATMKPTDRLSRQTYTSLFLVKVYWPKLWYTYTKNSGYLFWKKALIVSILSFIFFYIVSTVNVFLHLDFYHKGCFLPLTFWTQKVKYETHRSHVTICTVSLLV